MSPQGRNQVRYNKTIDQTYISDPTGKFIGTLEGDHTNNPLAYQGNVMDIQNVEPPQTRETGPQNIKQMEKDFVVNMATAVPSMLIPGGGLGAAALRGAGSMGLGTAVDQLLNKEKPISQSLGDVGLNTLINEVTAFPFEHKLKFEIPGITRTERGTVIRDPTLYESSAQGSRTSYGSGSTTGEFSGIGKSTSKGTSESVSIRQPYQGDMTPDMEALNARIVKLQGIEPKTKSQATQVNNLIDKLTEAMDAEAALSEGTITRTKGSSEGSSTSQSSRSSKGTSTSVGSGQNTINSKGMSQPGAATSSKESVTMNSSIWERLFNSIKVASKGQPLSKLDRALLNLGFNILADTTVNAPKD